MGNVFSGFARFKLPGYDPTPIDSKKSLDIVQKSFINEEGYFALIVENKSKNEALGATFTFKSDRMQNSALLTPTPTPYVYKVIVGAGQIQTIVGR